MSKEPGDHRTGMPNQQHYNQQKIPLTKRINKNKSQKYPNTT